MVIETVIPSQLVLLDVWENPIDPILSSDRKIFFDTMRQFKLCKGADIGAFTLIIQKRETCEDTVQVRDNLWRIMKAVSGWRTLIEFNLRVGNGKIETLYHDYRYSLKKITNEQYEVSIAYESRNALAEQARRYIFAV